MATRKRKREVIDRAALGARIEEACADIGTASERRSVVLEQLKSAIEDGRTRVQTRFEAVEIDGNAAKGELESGAIGPSLPARYDNQVAAAN